MEWIEYHFESLISTNEWAKEYLKKFTDCPFILVTAETQTGGRGQFGRTWISPPGVNLYGSFIFFLQQEEEGLSLTHLLAHAIIKTLEEKGVACQIKWPNDLLIQGKKISGILCETVPFSDRVGVILGFGININMTKEALEKINQPATSLFAETGELQDRSLILATLKEYFWNDLLLFRKRK